jgi:hypothetical protein
MGFASSLLPSDTIDSGNPDNKSANAALKTIDVALAKSGIPRSERRALIKEITSTPCAADVTTPCADNKTGEALSSLLKTLTQ